MGLSDFIKREMAEKKINSYSVALKCGGGISPSYVDQLKSGKLKNPTVDKLKSLSIGLMCDYYYLLEAAGYINKLEASRWLNDYHLDDSEMIELLSIYQSIPDKSRAEFLNTMRILAKGLAR